LKFPVPRASCWVMTSTLLTPCFRRGLVSPVTEMARIATPQSKSRVVLCLLQTVLGTSEFSHGTTRKHIPWAGDGKMVVLLSPFRSIILSPFGAAIPSNPTLRGADARPRSDGSLALLGRGTGLSPSGALHSGRLVPRGNARDDASPNYNSGRTPSGPRICESRRQLKNGHPRRRRPPPAT
jgi:hypothetical protein